MDEDVTPDAAEPASADAVARARRPARPAALAAEGHPLPERPDDQPARLDARAVRRVLVPHDHLPVGRHHDARRALRLPAAGRRLDLRRGLGRPPQPQVPDHRGRCRDRSLDARPGARHDDRLRRGVAHLPHDGGPLGGRRHPDARGLGADPADHADAQPHARERHQRLDPIGDGPARTGGGRGDLRLVIGVDRRQRRIARADLLHRRRHRDHRDRAARVDPRRRGAPCRRRADRLLRRPRRRRAVRRPPRVRALAAGAVRDHLRAHRRALQPDAPDARALVRRGRAAERREPRGARDRLQRRDGARRDRRGALCSPSAAASA